MYILNVYVRLSMWWQSYYLMLGQRKVFQEQKIRNLFIRRIPSEIRYRIPHP